MPNIHITNDASGPTMRLEDGTPVLKDLDFRCGLWENMFGYKTITLQGLIRGLYRFDSYPADTFLCLERFGPKGIIQKISEELIETDIRAFISDGIRNDPAFSDILAVAVADISLPERRRRIVSIINRYIRANGDSTDLTYSVLDVYAQRAMGDMHTCLYRIWCVLGHGCAAADTLRATWYDSWRTQSIERVYELPIQSPADDYGDIDAIRFDEAMMRIFEVALDVTRRMRSSKQEAKEAK